MHNVIIVGMQWGDEGKGKIVDLLTDHADAVVRFQGGNNAGHSLIHHHQKIVLRLIPSGALHPHVQCFLGNGMVVSPKALVDEIKELANFGFPLLHRLFISKACTLLLPYHVILDSARETNTSKSAIGTTKRGIGPAYEDKVARRALHAEDLLNQEVLAEKLAIIHDYHSFILENYYGVAKPSYNHILDELLSTADILRPLIADVGEMLHNLQQQKKRILFEGAQGTFLDIDHGTYPYVTSSNTVAGAAAVGTGLGPLCFDGVLGICKAYTTRVGDGPFLTELHDDIGRGIAERGQEFGSVTKRPRRCGWFDAVAMRESVRLNSVTYMGLTKLDVLDGLEKVKVCVNYKDSKPIYEEFPGWKEVTFGVTNYDDLPANAKHYLKHLEQLTGVPMALISTGPEKHHIIKLHDIF